PVAYGFGWFLDPWQGHPRAWHHGETMGFRSIVERFPADGVSVIVLANRGDIDLKSLGLEIAAAELGASLAPHASEPRPRPPRPDRPGPGNSRSAEPPANAVHRGAPRLRAHVGPEVADPGEAIRHRGQGERARADDTALDLRPRARRRNRRARPRPHGVDGGD